MLYIGLFILNTVNQVDLSQAGDKSNVISMFIQIILFSMFLVGGLIFSIQSGGAVAQTVQKQGSKLALGAGALLGTKALKRVTGSQSWQNTQEKLEKSRLAPIHDLGISMGKMPAKIRETELKNFEDNYKKMPGDQIRSDLEVHKKDKARVAIGLSQLAEKKAIDYNKDREFVKIAQGQPSLNASGIKKTHPELYAEFFTQDMENKIQNKLTTLPQGTTKADAKNLVINDLLVEQIRKSSPDDIKNGNWTDITKRIEAKGLSDKFFEDLLDKGFPASKLANMINTIDNSDELKDFADRFKKAVGTKINSTNNTDIVDYLNNRPEKYKTNKTVRITLGL